MDTLQPGGINNVVFEIAKGLSKKGNNNIIVFNPSWDNNSNMVKIIFIDNFKLVKGYKYKNLLYGFDIKNVEIVKNILNFFNPNIIHLHGIHTLFSPEMIYIIKKYYANIPVVFSPHLDATRSTFAGNHLWKIYKLFIKKIINSVDWIIVASKFELNLLIQQFSINQNKVTIIPHGVDIINTEKFRIKTNDIRLLYVGYLIKRKRVDYILKSLHSLIYDYKIKNILLTIIGEGSEKKNLFKLSKKLKIDDKIIWRTFLPRKELEKEFKNSDVVLLLSESEAYGITVAEALALGTPVIVTKQTALKEFLNEPGCFGVSYPPNPKEVAKLILKIINTGVKVGPFSNRKIRLWNEVVSEYEKVYIDLLKCKNV